MIENLKDLERLMKLCRKQGIVKLKLATVELEFGDLPMEPYSEKTISGDPTNPLANFPQGELSPEQLIFYSSGGNPEDDPENMQ